MRKSFSLLLILFTLLCAGCQPSLQLSPSPEPLVPTPPVSSATQQPLSTVDLSRLPATAPEGRDRFGVGVPVGPITDYATDRIGIGWYLNWRVEPDPPQPGGIDFWQMVRVSEEGYRPNADDIRAAAESNPGSIWVIGNEPDVVWQDNVEPERYAEIYHELYLLLKESDPSCSIAIGGVSQPTPLRLEYLDRVLSAYEEQFGEPIKVDIWNIHGFILREEAGSWGVGIPPGFNDEAGILYEIQDHDDLRAFQDHVLAFRRWMAERGQRDRPLVVSEYGIVMPWDYGFETERVQEFMVATFDYFLTAADPEVGYPEDENRLVQWWAWYSLADTVYPTGNLFDPSTRAPTPLGEAFATYSPPWE